MDGVFDRAADSYDEVVPFFATFGQRLVRWAGISEGDRVLDVGAGRGAVTFAALGQVGISGSVLAIDVAPRMIDQLAGTADADRLTARVMDAARLELPDESYDVVLSGFTMHILPDVAGALGEIARVLRPDGSLVCSVPGPVDDGGWWVRYGEIFAEFRRTGNIEAPAGMDTEFSAEGLYSAADSAGFDQPSRRDEQAHLPLSGPEQYWDWLLSHGNRWLYDALDSDTREQFRSRVLASLREDHPTGGRTLDAGATFYRLRRR